MNGSIYQKSAIIFVYGFGSSNLCWNKLVALLRADERITSEFDFAFFEYPSNWFEFNSLRKIPPLKEVAESLGGFIDSPEFYDRELILVGHSQGGLVIQSYLAQALEAGKGEVLKNLRQVILLATPNSGSTFLSWLRKLISICIFFTPQERTLRVLNDEIARVRKVIIERVVGTMARSATHYPIPIHSFYGTRDGVVPRASADTPFTYVTALNADHFSIINPVNSNDDRYREFCEALLEPSGHPNIYEVDSYDTVVTVEPNLKTQECLCKYGDKTRIVYTDNIGHMERRVRFSRKNQCKLPFTIKYRTTCDGGCVEYSSSHDNEAEPEQIGRYYDQGEEIVFKISPEAGKTYWIKVDIYGGFGEGRKNICFHIGKDGYCKKRLYTLNLTKYISAGYVISQTPMLFFYSDDPDHRDVSKPKDPDKAVKPIREDSTGIWVWELRRVWEGLVYLVWNVRKLDSV